MKKPIESEAKIESRLLKELVPHPLQTEYFMLPTESEIDALAKDIKRNGMREPIEVLPKGNKAELPANTILSGHSRKRAQESLDKTSLQVRVRYDLMQATANEILYHLLEANQNRRHLDNLALARSAKAMYLIEKKTTYQKLSSTGEVELRDIIGKRIGMSGRNLSRYFQVLTTPIEVQHAFSANKLSLVLACKVAGLAADKQKEIAKRIQKKEAPLKVVNEFIVTKNAKHTNVPKGVRDFVKSLDRGIEDLAPRLKEVRPASVLKCAKSLKRAKQLIIKLLDIAESASAKPESADAA